MIMREKPERGWERESNLCTHSLISRPDYPVYPVMIRNKRVIVSVHGAESKQQIRYSYGVLILFPSPVAHCRPSYPPEITLEKVNDKIREFNPVFVCMAIYELRLARPGSFCKARPPHWMVAICGGENRRKGVVIDNCGFISSFTREFNSWRKYGFVLVYDVSGTGVLECAA